MKEKVGLALFGIGMVLLTLSMTFIIAVLSTSPITSREFSNAVCYFGVLVCFLIFGSYLHRSRGACFTHIEQLACGFTSILLTALLLDGGKVLRATWYALIPYFMLITVLALRWRNLSRLELWLIQWAWLPFLVVLAPIIHRAFEGKLSR